MVEDTQDGVLAALRADELDCAFTALNPDALGNEFAATLLWEEEIVVALPPGHALCGRDHVTFEQLAAEDLIAYRENSALRRRLERTMADRGLEPRNAFVCTEMGAVRGAGEQGPRRRGHPALGRRAARPADRAAADRARPPHLADRARLARRRAARRPPARRSSRSRSATPTATARRPSRPFCARPDGRIASGRVAADVSTPT